MSCAEMLNSFAITVLWHREALPEIRLTEGKDSAPQGGVVVLLG